MARKCCGRITVCRARPARSFMPDCTSLMPSWCCARAIVPVSTPIPLFSRTTVRPRQASAGQATARAVTNLDREHGKSPLRSPTYRIAGIDNTCGILDIVLLARVLCAARVAVPRRGLSGEPWGSMPWTRLPTGTGAHQRSKTKKSIISVMCSGALCAAWAHSLARTFYFANAQAPNATHLFYIGDGQLLDTG
jgi:hypothetical protein